MKIVNAVVAILILVMGAGTLGARIFFYPDLGVEYVNVTMKLGSLFFILLIVGFGLVCIWAEKELWAIWDRGSWVVMNVFTLGFLYLLMEEEGSIGRFIYEGIVLSIKNLI